MKVEIVCSLLLLGVVGSLALKCYVCDGHDSFVEEGSCGDEFDTEKSKDFLLTCNSTQKWCKKVKIGANHVWTKVTRECAEECEEENIAYVHRTVCCNNENGCNAADATTASFFLALGSAFLHLIFQ